MVYIVTVDQVECWFVAFNREEEWKLQTTKGVSRTSLSVGSKNELSDV
jgi:hypothetical protein